MELLHLAGCIIRDQNEGILLVHRNTPKRKQWEIPGGKLDDGEEAAITAAREVREELGVEVKVLNELGTRSFQEDGYTMKYTWFQAQIVNGTPTVMEPRTHDDWRFFTVEGLEDIYGELSPNTTNFLNELLAGRISF